ncbi:asparagine synthase (glutamine-hydrolyzing) [Chitinolyticbacter meiyuanensis]|uniref:asparagine synthase (glutamine-hydrolyzing) n=1 Tax=Chitinolyticbacter meiyuanensis TaxID=682798 RepID=UPI0011E5CF62|nr:asparagine synthase (glutamine-hydrolyzing) [Chitinolyticbacter meiyuanensis]
MCGILGYFSRGATPLPEAALGRALRALAHRGPDDAGSVALPIAGGHLALGHTRLSIIDLSAAGHQPMQDPSERYWLVFNGEIYNYPELRQALQQLGHHFAGHSDTEVLLAAWAQWGLACLSRLTGMFAFAVLDRVACSLTLVRDHFGIKPLFYACNADGVRFASELGALRQLLPGPLQADAAQVVEYLLTGRYDRGGRTFHAGISQLPPGHLLQLDLRQPGQAHPERWWWPEITERRDLSFGQAAEALRAMFLDSVRLHLRSDVPLGAALSGGVDSSAIVCAMRHLEPALPIHTFSFVAPGDPFDEERWADQVNARVGAVAHKVELGAGDLLTDLDDLIRSQGEPFGSTSIFAQYRVFRLVREAGVTVTLDGQGADELLAGYPGYLRWRLASLLEQRRWGEIARLLPCWAAWPGRGSWRRAGLALGAAALGSPTLARVASQLSGQDPAPRWLRQAYLADLSVPVAWFEPTPSDSEACGRRLMQALRASLTGGGLASLLRHGDRNSMRWSVESRVPFLTPVLAEFVLSLPEDYLLSPEGETKSVFRAALRGIVPDAILDRRDKIGFQTPEYHWLSERADELEHTLSAAECLPFLDVEQVRLTVRAMLRGERPWQATGWRLINVCRWLQLQ